MLLGGCSALSNPVANGIPVRRLPPELLGESKAGLRTIPLSTLRQDPPKNYLIGPEDILGIWIEGILGEKGALPPVKLPESGSTTPSMGLPIPVRSDGTITLPYVAAIKVEGLTLEQAETAIRKAYTVDKNIIQPGRDRIYVSLQMPRRSHILVIRQDSTAPDSGSGGGAGGRAAGFIIGIGGGGRGARRGTGYAIDLPVYENDVLNALARTGGFPGTDAVNEIVIERGAFRDEKGRDALRSTLQTCPTGQNDMARGLGDRTIRIPLRTQGGQAPSISQQDIILQTGDVVFIEAREADVFYTAGLLPPGEYVLPRDVDLDVVEAIARVGGVINSGAINALNIEGIVTERGMGIPSPSLVTIIRRTPNCGQVAIRVDLNRALRDARERVLIQPRDVILLQQTPQDAFAGYFTKVFNFTAFYKLVDSSRATVTTNLSVP